MTRQETADTGERVESRTGLVHAVGRRRRAGRRTTVCGIEIDHRYTLLRGSPAYGCEKCRGILEDPERFRGGDVPRGGRR